MPDKEFTPFAIIPTPKYNKKDIENDFGYKGQPDKPVENVTILEDALGMTPPKYIKIFK